MKTSPTLSIATLIWTPFSPDRKVSYQSQLNEFAQVFKTANLPFWMSDKESFDMTRGIDGEMVDIGLWETDEFECFYNGRW